MNRATAARFEIPITLGIAAAAALWAYQIQVFQVFRYWDSDEYFLMAQQFAAGDNVTAAAPYAYRVLTPWLVATCCADNIQLGFLILNLLFVLFRAPSIGAAWSFLSGLVPADRPFGRLADFYLPCWYAVFVLGLDLAHERKDSDLAILEWPWPLRGLLYAVMLSFLVFWSWGLAQPFIYFQF